MIHWIVFSTLATVLFYGLYCLTFKRDRWLQLSRCYLMVTLLFSLVYPLVRLLELPLPLTAGMVLPSMEVAGEGTAVLVEAPALDGQPMSGVPSRLLMVVYFLGLGMTLLLLTVQIARQVFAMRRQPTLLCLDDDTEPYSFFNHIVIGTRGMSDEELQCVLAHEQEHVRRRHTLDVLLMRLMCCAAWYSPFAWLMLRELRAVHEYQADAAALGDNGRMMIRPYISLLYRQVTGHGYGHITNNFQSINIKNRIVMMNKTKTRFGAWKLLAALPVAALLMAVGCNNAEAASAEVQPGRTLLRVNYNRTGGKALPFGGIGYNKVSGQWNREYPQSVQVTCSGEGLNRSYDTWEISEFQTTKGLVDGKVLNRNERKLIKAIDRNLRNGKVGGTIVRHARVKATEGKVDLAFVATWMGGNSQGDADFLIKVIEEGAPEPENPVFEVPDTDPEFVGGMEALYKYLAENIHYPKKAKSEGIQGRVFVSFVIEADGSVTNAKVVRSIGGGCDEEALRVVEAMPKWKPGTKDGKPVRVNYNLPIVFKLSEK